MDWQTGAASPGPTIDRTSLLAFVGDDERLLAELTDLFMRECPDRLGAIAQAVQRRDPLALQRAAHQLRGALALFGARDAAETAQQLERMGRDRAIESAPEAFAALQQETHRLLAELGESQQKS